MSVKQQGLHANQDLAFAVPMRPISDADFALVQGAMAEIAPEWAVEQEGVSDDEITLVLVPEDGDDSMGPSFIISRKTYGLRLDQVHWEVLTEVGVFASMNDVVAALASHLAFYPDLAVPASIRVH